MAEHSAFHAYVHGTVQGVGFRDFVLHHARALGLTGYVRNVRKDRSVEVWAEGDPETLERLERQLRKGPLAAVVRSVDMTTPAPTGG
jgi:acylphosphatase